MLGPKPMLPSGDAAPAPRRRRASSRKKSPGEVSIVKKPLKWSITDMLNDLRWNVSLIHDEEEDFMDTPGDELLNDSAVDELISRVAKEEGYQADSEFLNGKFYPLPPTPAAMPRHLPASGLHLHVAADEMRSTVECHVNVELRNLADKQARPFLFPRVTLTASTPHTRIRRVEIAAHDPARVTQSVQFIRRRATLRPPSPVPEYPTEARPRHPRRLCSQPNTRIRIHRGRDPRT